LIVYKMMPLAPTTHALSQLYANTALKLLLTPVRVWVHVDVPKSEVFKTMPLAPTARTQLFEAALLSIATLTPSRLVVRPVGTL
jgi:hypothetical protein